MSILLLAFPLPQRFLRLSTAKYSLPYLANSFVPALSILRGFLVAVQHKYGIIIYFNWPERHNSTLKDDELKRATFFYPDPFNTHTHTQR